jgi:hypothetical protein
VTEVSEVPEMLNASIVRATTFFLGLIFWLYIFYILKISLAKQHFSLAK